MEELYLEICYYFGLKPHSKTTKFLSWYLGIIIFCTVFSLGFIDL